MTACRQSATQPLVPHPGRPPPLLTPPPLYQKKKEEEDQRHFRDKPYTGGRGSIVFVSKCSECDTVVMTDTPKTRAATFCRFLPPPGSQEFLGSRF